MNEARETRVTGLYRPSASPIAVSTARVSLAWLLAQGADIVPIPGVKRLETMRDSARAPEVTLTGDDISDIVTAPPKGGTAGPRYNEAGMARVNL